MASKGGRLLKRAFWLAVGAAALVFAVEGGEFGTRDLIRNRREMDRIARSIDSLRHVVDSLRRYKDSVERIPAMQERIAREQFGMLRGDKELLYRFTGPSADSARAGGGQRTKR